MVKKLITAGLILGLLLLLVASQNYPGGNNLNVSAPGYDWQHNYLSDLLSPVARNGSANTARPWAIPGILFITLGFGAFFVDFSRKIGDPGAAKVLKYLGVAVTVFAFLTVIPPLHDSMVTISSILTLIVFFYITVFTFKSRLHFLKLLSVVFLSSFYLAAYMYFTRSYLELMPLMQKLIFFFKIIWVLLLLYFARKEDFITTNKVN